MADFGMEIAVFRFRRLFEAASGLVEQPAVERAAQPAVLEPAKTQIGAAVRAFAPHQPVAAGFGPEQHQILAEQADGFGRPVAVELFGQGGRLPVAAHQLAAARAAAGFGD